MTPLVIYDSLYGNTKLIAEAVGRSLGPTTPVVAVTEATPATLTGVHLLVAGSPINGWRPSARMGAFLARLQPGQLRGVRVATFDTRVKIFFHGDAAKKILAALTKVGATVVGEPQGFLVRGTKGPLVDGEVERAAAWAKEVRGAGEA